MAYTATHTGASGSTFRSVLTRIGEVIVAYGETRARYNEIQMLQGLSDAELAERGLKREDIVRHVYADMLYL